MSQSLQLGKPPMATSTKLAAQAIRCMEQPDSVFPQFNEPQKSAIAAALSRRLTLIQGPPGTGKTTVAAAIAFGFVLQCKSSISATNAKVLCTAFSNVGADNLAEAMLRRGLRVVRLGQPTAVAESLWPYTLEAAIDRDPAAQRAIREAAATKGRAATAAVQAAQRASAVAATRAMRAADVIVATSTGAADPRLLAACGIVEEEEGERQKAAPDGLPPLSLPFVIHDEACQSTEPASLIPILSSNSCRALVLVGDPCQLPPTVLSKGAASLSVSLMERLSATLPNPCIIPQPDLTKKDSSFLDSLAIKQAVSLVRARSKTPVDRSYRRIYSGAVLLSIQYRMHPSIAALPSALFYNSLLTTPESLLHRPFPSLPSLSTPGVPDTAVRLIDVGGPDNEKQGSPGTGDTTDQRTYWNEVEARKVVEILRDVVSSGNSQVSTVGVISPYQGQVQLIKNYVARDAVIRKSLLSDNQVFIEVNSVDGYQGRERDLIIFSAVRSNRRGKIGFLQDWRRMNVALTRAKSGLVIIGDIEMLGSANRYWDALRKWATGVRCLTDDAECFVEEDSL